MDRHHSERGENMTVSEVIKKLQTMIDGNIILPESELEIYNISRDEMLEIYGFNIFSDGSVDLKAREK
jgi:hypothetical protein